MPSFKPWRNHQDIYCAVDCYLPATQFTFSDKGITSCIFPDGQIIAVGDVIDGKTVKAIEKTSECLMLNF